MFLGNIDANTMQVLFKFETIKFDSNFKHRQGLPYSQIVASSDMVTAMVRCGPIVRVTRRRQPKFHHDLQMAARLQRNGQPSAPTGPVGRAALAFA
jgi:hypothetical protein